MADNVAITAGSGTTIAADEVTDVTLGTSKVQFIKIMDGTLDGTNKATVRSNGALQVDITSVAGTSPNANGTNTQANSAPVVNAYCTIGTQTSVSGSASSGTILASNTSRMGATIYNDSTAILYLLLKTGGTASNSAYTVQVAANGYYEVPFRYSGDIIGIWASATGNARVTELT